MVDQPTNLPTLNIRCGQPATVTLTWLDANGDALDLTTWTARFAIAETYGGAAIVEVLNADITKTAGGVVSLAMDGATTLLLQPYGCDCLVFQLDLVDATGAQSARFQGRVMVFERIEA